MPSTHSGTSHNVTIPCNGAEATVFEGVASSIQLQELATTRASLTCWQGGEPVTGDIENLQPKRKTEKTKPRSLEAFLHYHEHIPLAFVEQLRRKGGELVVV